MVSFPCTIPYISKFQPKERLNTSPKSIPWKSAKCTNEMLQAKLIESIIRFLRKKNNDLQEIFEFSEKIKKERGKSMSSELREITAILHNLKEAMQKEETSHYQDPIALILDSAQKIVTRKNFRF